MAVDTQYECRIGDKFPVYGTFSADSGTGTIQSGSLFTLYDYKGSIAGGLSSVAVTGYDSAPLVTGNVWYDLDTNGLLPGTYYGWFAYSVAGSDSLTRNRHPDAQITILPFVEMVASYDPLNVRGQVRLWLRDIDTGGVPATPGTPIGLANPIWDDNHIDNFLLQAGFPGVSTSIAASTDGSTVTDTSITYVLAASILGWEKALGDAAKVAVIEKIAIFSDNTKTTFDAIKEYIQWLKLRLQQEGSPLFSVNDTFYQLTISTSNPQPVPPFTITGNASLESW